MGITRPPRWKGSGTWTTDNVVVVVIGPGIGVGVGVVVGDGVGLGVAVGLGVTVGVTVGVAVGVAVGVGLGVGVGVGVMGTVRHRAKVWSCMEFPVGRFWPPAWSKAVHALGLVVPSVTSVGGVAGPVEG